MAALTIDLRRASEMFLREWDPKLASALEQLSSVVFSEAAALSTIAASVNLRELQERATQVMGKTCTGAHLLALGGYNVVYLLPFDDGTDIVARLRIPGGGLGNNGRGMSTEDLSARFSSEIATLLFLRANAPSIPAPELYAWDGDNTNPVGAPYMLMQRPSGVLLSPIMDDITAVGWAKLAAQVATFEAELYDRPMSSIGCLVDAAGTVGPLVRTCTSSLLPNDRGPFTSSKEFLLAFVNLELDLVTAPDEWTAKRTACANLNGGVEALSRQYAERWFRLLRDAIIALPEELPSSAPVFRLAHTDFNEANLLISSAEDPTIVAVLDWEGAQVLPSWDARAGLSIWWLLEWMGPDGEREVEKEQLRQIYAGVITERRELGQSPLCFERLLRLLQRRPSFLSDRQQLDDLFLGWFSAAEAQAKTASCLSELEAFRSLEVFIKSQ
ncbi:hypothetical protein GGX14DRAFT_562262 [Mycena pura]|uniref:Aminoglycoside phosphotransferase domain-containing protein n=1 Tax=Mycena pura TaxID=153505 RepID=A0AAD6YES8_9AGAR|nr:hypothetical protein GGX14DRAFT_562262 [Mycena pura]